MKTPHTFVFILAGLSFLFLVNGCQHTATVKLVDESGAPLNRWNKKLTDVIVEDIFTPPVASRIYAYSNIAAYEALVHAFPGYYSLGGQLNAFKSVPAPPPGKPCNYEVAACVAFCSVGTRLVYSEKLMSEFLKNQLDSFRVREKDNEVIDNSIAFGKQIADSVVAWAKTDMYNATRSYNRYTPVDSIGKWKPTPPDFMFAVEPYWGVIRPFALVSCDQFTPPPPPAYDLKKTSTFYRHMTEVYETVNHLSDEQKEIARYWDDNPNVSTHSGHYVSFAQKMTPGGHWMAITALAARTKNLNLMQTSEAFTLASIAMADAFKGCWSAKFKYNTIRPITAINDNLDAEWQPYLQTPPFPEYPSGHSSISAAAAEVLSALVSNDFSFTDSSEVEYGMPVRSFHSFREAAHEAMISRMYGGIHFRYGNEAGAALGKQTGEYVMAHVITRNRNSNENKNSAN